MKRAISMFLVLALSTVMSAGCKPSSSTSSSTSKGGGGKDKPVICLLPKAKGITYFTSCYNGAKEAADELGTIELIYDGPTDGDSKKQAEMIEQWIEDEVDAICVSSSGPDVVANAMREARDAGIHVITWDADADKSAREFFVNQATAQAIGEGMVNAMVTDLGGPETEGDVVIISSEATSDNQNAWIAAMEPALAKTKLKLATIKYPGENSANALADATDVIKKYPNLKGIFGISSVSFPGAAEAVEQSGKIGQILVTGLGTPNSIKKFVHNGTVKSFVLWNTKDLGYLTIHVADGLVSGKLKPGATSFSAGRLGEKKIVDDNVLLGDILVFTKENIDQFDF